MERVINSYTKKIRNTEIRFLIRRVILNQPAFKRSPLPTLPSSKVTELLKLNNPVTTRLVKSLTHKDEEEAINNLRIIVEREFVKVILTSAQLLSLKRFNIVINYTSDHDVVGVVMFFVQGNVNTAEFNIYVAEALIEAILKKEVGHIVRHELIHYIDRQVLEKFGRITEGLDKGLENQKYPREFISLYKIFVACRVEGIAKFYEDYTKKLRIDCNPEHLEKLKELIENVVKYGTVMQHDYYPVYTAGAVIAALIIAKGIVINGKEDLISIKTKALISKGREYKIKDINKFFGIRNFDVYFINDIDLRNWVNKRIKDIVKLNHLQFFGEYENACKFFKIKKYFFDSRSYHYYATLSIFRYKKHIQRSTDTRILGLMGKFLRKLSRRK